MMSLSSKVGMRVVILDDFLNTLRGLPSFAKLAGHEVAVMTEHVENTDELAKQLEAAEALVLFRERTKVTETLLSKLPNLKLISQRSVYPHVDVPACTRHGVLLCSDMYAGAPNYAAAEHTWALIMAAMKNIPSQCDALRTGQWQTKVGRTLRGKTLGLYGYGRIAKEVAGFARAFGMNVLWWASEDGRARAVAEGEMVASSREVFFKSADVVSIHVRLKPETRGVVTAEDLATMRPDALFVNTSRAELVEPDALLAAVDNGRPGMAAVDVFDKEPITEPNNPLVSHPRIIATPHVGFMTEEELDLQFSDIYDQVNAFAQGKPINTINPEVLASE